jgi:AcrR family transcriptional regulator
LPPERITARVIAEESDANLASITYHFGSKESLVTEAVVEGLDRWLADVASSLGELGAEPPAARFRRAAELIQSSRRSRLGLAKTFVRALARAQHDPIVQGRLAAGFHRSRPNVASVLGLGRDAAAHDTAGLVLALFHGLLIQVLLDPALAIDGTRMTRAQARLRKLLPRA